MDEWLRINHPDWQLEWYVDDAIILYKSEAQVAIVNEELNRWINEFDLELHPVRIKKVYCKDSNRRGTYERISFDFLGYTFKPRVAKNSIRGVWFTNWLPTVSSKAIKSMNEKMKGWRILRASRSILSKVIKAINPVMQG